MKLEQISNEPRSTKGEWVSETDGQKEIALEVGSLSTRPPSKTFPHTDVHDRIWRAFELGREYEKNTQMRTSR